MDALGRYSEATGGSRSRRRSRAIAAIALVALTAAALAAPGVAHAANAYGQIFNGQPKCLVCHGNVTGRWQAGTYVGTAHSRFVVDVTVATASLVPTSGSPRWPSPAFGGGLSFGPTDVAWQIGQQSGLRDFVSIYANDANHTLSTGMVASMTTGPADDRLMFDPLSYDTVRNMWELENPVKVVAYFQRCGGCHNLGVTRPSDVTYTLPSGATMSHSTETSYAGLSIQCENCHGTGRTPGSSETTHWTLPTSVVRTKRVLESQTCGQCHATLTAKQKRYEGGTSYFSNANGFTCDQTLTAFVDVYGASYVPTSAASVITIPAGDKRFYPSGHNKGAKHFYYNEWSISKHARALRYADGSWFTPTPRAMCLPCHSGEGFLKSIGYGSDSPNDIFLTPSSLASDTLDVECGVCHTVHARTGEALGLRLPVGQLCEKCHNGMVAVGQEATPGAHPHHGPKEVFEGYGLIGVPRPSKRFMGGAECPDCHMPKTREGMASHRFTPMMPGDAEAWGVPEFGDSCTTCHKSESRAALQAAIDRWQAATEAGLEEASVALAAAVARPASATPAGIRLISSARTNLWLIHAEKSDGVHNFPYTEAGIAKTIGFARSVGSTVTAFRLTAFDSYHGLSVLLGKLVGGDGTAVVGAKMVVEAQPGGTSGWSVVGSATTDSAGDFLCAVTPTGTTSYRVKWTAFDAATTWYSPARTLYFYSSTSARVSASRIRVGGYVTVYGAVAPNHAGQRVTVHYKRGTGSWRVLGYPTLTASSTYAIRPRLPYRGYYYFHTHFGGDASHLGSTSPTVRVYVY